MVVAAVASGTATAVSGVNARYGVKEEEMYSPCPSNTYVLLALCHIDP